MLSGIRLNRVATYFILHRDAEMSPSQFCRGGGSTPAPKIRENFSIKTLDLGKAGNCLECLPC